jgi:hypothetical protein
MGGAVEDGAIGIGNFFNQVGMDSGST